MECRTLGPRITLHYPPSEAAAADLLLEAIEGSASLLGKAWGLRLTQRCRVYVMTGWVSFYFRALPVFFWPFVALALVVWGRRLRRVWPLTAGWTLRGRRRTTIGVKPPRLLATADRAVGRLLFVEQPDLAKKAQYTACHELTHAFTARLKLPLWLNEGVAMLAVDRYAGQPTVRRESLDLLAEGSSSARPVHYRRLMQLKPEDMARQYARGYWTTRLLDENHPTLLRELLSRRHRARVIEEKVAAALRLERRDLWRSVDRLLAAHFAAAPPQI